MSPKPSDKAHRGDFSDRKEIGMKMGVEISVMWSQANESKKF